MELYTLSDRFIPQESVDEFASVIWTERYSAAGDVQLVVAPTPSMIDTLKPGTLLGLRGVKEVMQLETQSIENGLLTITGQSLPKFLDERTAWFKNPAYDGTDPAASLSADFSETTTPGQFVSDVVYNTVINPTPFPPDSFWAPINLDWAADKIPGLELGIVDTNGASKQLVMAHGQLYTQIQQLAAAEGLGFKLYLQSASYHGSPVFKFATYRGKNRTSEQTTNRMVRLSPSLDSLTDVKELVSVANYVNVVYVHYKNVVTEHYAPGVTVPPAGFDRRTLWVEAPDIFLEPDHIPPFRVQVANNTFAKQFYIQSVDGRLLPPLREYMFSVDYYLGDVIEIEGYSSLISKVRVTEYIRSQDKYGEQEYPTLAAIDPLETGYLPDLDPGTDTPDWIGDDPDYNFDFDIGDLGDIDDPTFRKRHRTKKRKHAHPADPADPNPDPTPVFPPYSPDGDPGDYGEPGPNAAPTTTSYVVVGYYPNQNNGEQIAYVTSDGRLLNAWMYQGEDQDPEVLAAEPWWEVLPIGWSADHQHILIRSEESKAPSDAFDWSDGFAWWLMHVAGGNTKLTQTIPRTWRSTTTDPLGSTFGWKNAGVMQLHSQDSWKLYLESTNYYPQETVFGDGTYWRMDLIPTDPDTYQAWLITHGDRQDNGGPKELYMLDSGTNRDVSEATKILGVEDFPPHMRWSDYTGPYPSPDGNKLLMSRRNSGPSSNYVLQTNGLGTGGTFTITLAYFGEAGIGITTVPIPYNADAETIYNAVLSLGILGDPRLLEDYPYIPYYMSGGQIQMRFHDPTSTGVYMVVHNDDITGGSGWYPYPRISERGPDHWYICNYDGTDLTEITLPAWLTARLNEVGWSADSTKLHAVIDSESGQPYSRWMTYSIADNSVAYPLDFSSESGPIPGYGPLFSAPIYSPDGIKIVYQKTHSGNNKSIWVANADGSSAVEVYTQTADSSSTDQSVLIPSRQMSWNFDSNKICIIDQRDTAPVWIYDTIGNTLTKIWPGLGWTNPDEQKWIYDPQMFDG